jgi:hypothetical protein
MILYRGEVWEDAQQTALLKTLRQDCYDTIAHGTKIVAEDVIRACDGLAKKVRRGEFNKIIQPLLLSLDIPLERFEYYISMFERESIEAKCRAELGENYQNLPDLDEKNERRIVPLGILFHIAAGNADALPAYSVVEGLLAGNINILKLPSGDNGLSLHLLRELIQIEPKIKDYIYVFDVQSANIETLQIFADIADGIVVWGGDAAVSAAKKMASVTTKVIAWGHKLSFAYATLEASDEDLLGLAHHICETNQVLCSSCQGIFVDTESREALDTFARRFFAALKEANKSYKPVSIGMRGKSAIYIYNERLEQVYTGKTILSEDGVSVIVADDDMLELSMLFRNVWVKKLPRDKIIATLKPRKNHLQTAGLLCDEKARAVLAERLLRAGVIRVTKAKDMSRVAVGETHDGTYALREYTRIVETIKL